MITKYIFQTVAGVLIFMALADVTHAVPSLVSVVPVMLLLAVKGAMLLGALFFFILSLIKKKKKWFLIGGSILCILASLLVWYF